MAQRTLDGAGPADSAQRADVAAQASAWLRIRRSRVASAVSQQLAPFAMIIVICVALAIMSPYFLTGRNISAILVQMSTIAILAVGQTIVIVSAGIDLSVSTIVALVGVVSAGVIAGSKAGITVGILAGIVMGAVVGVINGVLVARLGLPAFIATLGTLSICGGVALLLSGGQAIYGLPSAFGWLGQGQIGPIPVPVLLMVLVAVFGHVLLSHTALGRAAYAIGGNPETARLSGINVGRVLIVLYIISGTLAGLAGTVEASRVISGQPGAGVNYNLNSIAAAVIGGASLFGGEGTVVGALIGALMLQLINNGSNLLNVSPFWQSVIIGVVVVLAVLYDTFRRRRAHS